VLILDSPHRENEGDLIIAAEHLTPAKCAFLIRHSSGYLCAPLPAARLAALNLPAMVAESQDPNRTAYTITVDAAAGVSTGISAADRATTCRLLADPAASASDFRRPGHIVPLAARDGGVRERRGHTEAGLDLCRMAGLKEASVIGEVVTDGEAVPGKAEYAGAGMMRGPECVEFARRWGIRICTIQHMVDYLEARDGKWKGGEGTDY
jgi:3,4-dihydroxy 2-butanone 4-phosphate synthase